MTFSYRLMLAILTGLLLTASFPPFDFYLFAWIAFVPLFFALWNQNKKQMLFFVSVSMFVFFLAFLHWLSVFGWAAWVASALYELMFPMIWSFVAYRYITGGEASFFQKLFPALSFTAVEAVRGLGPLGMPWGALGYSQWKFLPLIQLASITGVLGISFLVMMVNLLVFHGLRKKEIQAFGYAFLVIAIPVVFGCFHLHHTARDKMSVAVIQTNDSQMLKFDQEHFQVMLKEMDDLVTQAAKLAPELIVFPETSLAGFLDENPMLEERVLAWRKMTQSYLLVGTFRRTRGFPQNALVLVDPSGRWTQSYEKVKLVPMGEYLPLLFRPFRGHWHALDPIEDFAPGEVHTVFRLPRGSFGAMICFESSFGWIARKLATAGAQFLVVATNDAWFYGSLAQEVHASMAVFRAIETGRSCVQAGNTGISCVVDSRGRMLAWQPAKTKGVLFSLVPLESSLTGYDVCGDWFSFLCIFITVVKILMLFNRQRV